jgi:hypothetical protein
MSGEVTKADGSCGPAGVVECATGFASDGNGGCTAVLPPEACPLGKMATPGETSCRDVMPCGDGTWGDIADALGTLYVDGSFGGSNGDGSRAAPFTTIKAAIIAAPSGATIAIAAGKYAEALLVENKTLVFRGVCPAKVEVHAIGENFAGFAFRNAGASSITGLSVTSDDTGIMASGGEVTLDRVWVHDTGSFAVIGSDTDGPTKLVVRSCLFEHAKEIVLGVEGGDVVVESSLLRDAIAGPDGTGRAIALEESIHPSHLQRPSLTLRNSVVERNEEAGVVIGSSDALIEASVIRDQKGGAFKTDGRGLIAQPGRLGPASVAVRGSIFERNREIGLLAIGSELTVEDSVVRDTHTNRSGLYGVGIQVEPVKTPLTTSKLAVRRSLVERNHNAGIGVIGGTATLEALIVRGTLPREDGTSGIGVVVQTDVEHVAAEPLRVDASLRFSVIEDNFVLGVGVVGSHLVIEGVRIEGTKARKSDGNYGDGITAVAEDVEAAIEMKRSLVKGSARAGLSNFGGTVRIEDSSFECNLIDLNGEEAGGHEFIFDSRGTNKCGCEENVQCRAVSETLAPPPPR